jgi:hypothetical protein
MQQMLLRVRGTDDAGGKVEVAAGMAKAAGRNPGTKRRMPRVRECRDPGEGGERDLELGLLVVVGHGRALGLLLGRARLPAVDALLLSRRVSKPLGLLAFAAVGHGVSAHAHTSLVRTRGSQAGGTRAGGTCRPRRAGGRPSGRTGSWPRRRRPRPRRRSGRGSPCSPRRRWRWPRRAERRRVGSNWRIEGTAHLCNRCSMQSVGEWPRWRERSLLRRRRARTSASPRNLQTKSESVTGTRTQHTRKAGLPFEAAGSVARQAARPASVPASATQRARPLSSSAQPASYKDHRMVSFAVSGRKSQPYAS